MPCSFRIRLPSGTTIRADAALKILTKRAWQVASCGPGSKGDRRYAFAWIGTASDRHFLLIRRSLTKPTDLAYFYCYVPEHTPATLGVLVAVTGQRWTIEEDHEFGKDQFGFDQSQVRLYTPIMRHIVLVMAALAVCAVTAADVRTRAQPLPTPAGPTDPPPADLGLVPLTVVEIKKLFNLATRVWRSTSHYLHWSWWRRRHQARSRWYHHRARLTRGRIARRDIWLVSDGQLWRVRGRLGGDEGREVSYDFTDERSAREMVDRMMKASNGAWRDLTEAVRRESDHRRAP